MGRITPRDRLTSLPILIRKMFPLINWEKGRICSKVGAYLGQMGLSIDPMASEDGRGGGAPGAILQQG